MGGSLSKVQLPAGVPERMRQHCGRQAELNHYSPQPGGHVIHPRWSSPRCHSQGRGPWPCSNWRWPWCRKRGMCHCRVGVGWDVHDWLGQNTGERTQCWMLCWTGWKPERRLIWRHFWESMLLVKKADWFGGIIRILWFTRKPSTYAWCLRARMKIYCSLWSQGCTGLPLWMDVIEMQDIRAMTVPCPYCRSTFGGLGWPTRCDNPSEPAHAVYSTRAACWRPLYTPSWLLLPWISYMLTSPA